MSEADIDWAEELPDEYVKWLEWTENTSRYSTVIEGESDE